MIYVNSNCCLSGLLLDGRGRKFNIKKDHVRVINGICKISKECPQIMKEWIKIRFPCFEKFIFDEGEEFRTEWEKKKQMILEPIEGYEGLDYKGGGKKHAYKKGKATYQPFRLKGEPAFSYQEPEGERSIVLPEIEERQISVVEISGK